MSEFENKEVTEEDFVKFMASPEKPEKTKSDEHLLNEHVTGKVEEEVKEEVETIKEKEEEALKGPESEDKLKAALKVILGEDAIIGQEVDGEIVEKTIDELENLTQELFSELVQSKISDVEKQAEEKVRGNLGEFERKLISIKDKGGDVTDILEARKKSNSLMENLDLSNPTHRKALLAQKLSEEGNDSETIDILISGYENRGIFDKKVDEAEVYFTAKAEKDAEAKEQRLKEEEKEHKKFLREYKSNFKEGLSIFELKESYKDNLAKISTSKSGNNYEIDQLYAEMRKDPTKAARLSLFLHDTEEYDKQITKQKVNETMKSTSRKIFIAKKDSSGASLNRAPKEKGVTLQEFAEQMSDEK